MRKHRRNHITYKNTTANDLADILKEAENITLDNLNNNTNNIIDKINNFLL